MTELKPEHVQELMDNGDFRGEVEPQLARFFLEVDREKCKLRDALLAIEAGGIMAEQTGAANSHTKTMQRIAREYLNGVYRD